MAARRRLASRDRSSLARRACSASLRSMNCPICIPIAAIIRMNSRSTFLVSRAKNSITPNTPCMVLMGKPNALRTPSSTASALRGRLSSGRMSSIHRGVFEAQMRPGSPSPFSKSRPLVALANSGNRVSVRRQIFTQRSLPPSGSQSAAISHSELLQMVSRSKSAASSRTEASESRRVIACCAATRRSLRSCSVMSMVKQRV